MAAGDHGGGGGRLSYPVKCGEDPLIMVVAAGDHGGGGGEPFISCLNVVRTPLSWRCRWGIMAVAAGAIHILSKCGERYTTYIFPH